ncbi:MAG: glycerophosphodiester phosphodiesterase family protein [Pirellulales bacterium]
MHEAAALAASGAFAMTADFSQAAAEADSTSARPMAAELIKRPGLLVIAHRGLSSRFPENTLPAFTEALPFKPDFVELDYRHSSDGVPIVIHDSKLDRTTNSVSLFGAKEVVIGAKTAAELKPLDAGTWYDAKFAGTHLPTLDESLDAILAGSCCMVERKDGDAETLVELLHKKGVAERCIVQAFDWAFIADVRKLDPSIVTGLLGKEALDAAKIAKAREIGSEVVGWSHSNLTASEIAAAHAAGLKVWSYTVDKPDRARELAAAGLDGLITNKADLARAWLAESK